jgi:drug/metabolite transporter (DMT)-like permease
LTFAEFGLLLTAVLSSVVGQVLLKLGALKLGQVTTSNVVNLVFRMITIPELLGGLMAYGIGAVVYILLLTRVKLSVAGPSASLIYVFTVLLGYFIFQESLPPQRLIGLGFIICGVVLVATNP